MELKARCLCFVMMLLVAGFAGLETAHGAGECGRVPVDQVALKLAPCAAATQNPRGAVPSSCCLQVRSIGRNPKCLCAVMLSDTARRAGVKPAVATTIHPQALRHRQPPHQLQMWPVYPDMRSKGMELEAVKLLSTVQHLL